MSDEMPGGYGTLRTTGVRIRHQVSRRPAQRSPKLHDLIILIAKSRRILNVPPSLQVLSWLCDNALAQSESILQSSRVGWEHLEVLRSTGESYKSIWEVCVWLPDPITFCWWSNTLSAAKCTIILTTREGIQKSSYNPSLSAANAGPEAASTSQLSCRYQETIRTTLSHFWPHDNVSILANLLDSSRYHGVVHMVVWWFCLLLVLVMGPVNPPSVMALVSHSFHFGSRSGQKHDSCHLGRFVTQTRRRTVGIWPGWNWTAVPNIWIPQRCLNFLIEVFIVSLHGQYIHCSAFVALLPLPFIFAIQLIVIVWLWTNGRL
jgi:hypothetical protein